jgi:hypothetical protein
MNAIRGIFDFKGMEESTGRAHANPRPWVQTLIPKKKKDKWIA